MKGNFRRWMQRSNVYRGVRLNVFMGRLHLKNHATSFVLRCITSLVKAIGEIMTMKKIKIFQYWMQFSKTLKWKLLLFLCHRIATQFRVVDLLLCKLLWLQLYWHLSIMSLFNINKNINYCKSPPPFCVKCSYAGSNTVTLKYLGRRLSLITLRY